MSVARPPAPGTAVPDKPAAFPYEPGAPVNGQAWDVRSSALLAPPDVSADAPDGEAGVSAAPEEASGSGETSSSRTTGARTGSRVPRAREARATVRAATGPADPVRELMHRHRGLCERAVDPLEIAAGLEAVGVTDRTAARFRHRDVFSLAEELFARVPRVDGERDALSSRSSVRPFGSHDGSCNRSGASHCARGRTSRWLLDAFLVLLPALLTAACAALSATVPVRHAGGLAVAAVTAAAVLAVGASVRLVVRRLVGAKAGLPTLLSAGWLTGVVVCGDRLPQAQGGSAAAEAVSTVTVPLALACALVPAVVCARRFAAGARRRLAASRTLDEFAAGMWPLLTATVALFAAVVPVLQVLLARAAGTLAGHGGADSGGSAASGSVTAEALMSTTALGMLLFTALLLTAHGFRRAASAGLGIACGAEAVALAVNAFPATGRFLGPLHPEFVPAAVCAGVALGLLAWAYRLLSGAFAHHGRGRELGSVRNSPRHCADCARAGDSGLGDPTRPGGAPECAHHAPCPPDAHSSPDGHHSCGASRAHSETPWGSTP